MTQRTRISKRTSRKLSNHHAIPAPSKAVVPMQGSTLGKSRAELEAMHRQRCKLEQTLPRNQRNTRAVTLDHVREFQAAMQIFRVFMLSKKNLELYPTQTEDGWSIVRDQRKPARVIVYKCRAHGGYAATFPRFDETLGKVVYDWSVLRNGVHQRDVATDLEAAKRKALNALALLSIAKPAVIALPETPKTAAANMPRWKLSNTDVTVGKRSARRTAYMR
jgi:hypothetical protein